MKNNQYIRQAQHKKGFIASMLLAIIALLVIGGGVYVYNNKKSEAPTPVNTEIQQSNQIGQQINTQTPPINTQTNDLISQIDTSGWKTYVNTQYGFEIKYPENYEKFTESVASVGFASSKNCEDFNFMTADNPDEFKSCQKYSVVVQDNKITIEGNGVMKSNVEMGGITGEKIITLNEPFNGFGQIIIQAQKNNKWFIQTLLFHSSEQLKAEVTSNQIFFTFKFTK